MTRERTEKSKYKHHTTGEYCTCAAYIAERMCLNKAQFHNEGSLSYKFWNTKNWKWTFTKQVMLANKLIKKFGEKPVIKAVISDELKSTFSLNSKRALAVIKKYSLIKDLEVAVPPPVIIENPQRRKSSFKKKSVLDKLREIEFNGKKEGSKEE